MNSIRKKFYTTYILITLAGAVGLKEYADQFRALPPFHGIDLYAAFLGGVYLVISAILLEFFVFMRIQYISKELESMKTNGYGSKKKIVDLSRKDELGKIVENINEAMSTLHNRTDKMHHKNSLYLSLVEDPCIFVYRFRNDGTVTFINKSYADMLGTSYKEVVGRNIYEVLGDGGDLQQKLSCLNPLCSSSAISFEVPKIIGQAEPKWIAWSASAVFNDVGRAEEYQVVGINMHQRNIEARSQSEEYDNIFLLTLDGKIAYAPNISKYENIVGEQFLACLHEDDAMSFAKTFDHVVKTKKNVVRNVRMKHSSFAFTAQVLIEASIDKEGSVSSISVKMVDITDIEGAQAKVVGAVNNMNRLLEEQVSYVL